MQFKHPEILYALLLLIIPILVHLFQLQRFVKVPFTNVKILKTIEKQTRKSARLKKWLILITRLLIFTCLIIAFAQPYFSKYSTHQNFNTTIYLDNSFSMQAKGESGELLKSAAQQIIENNINPNSTISLITNDKVFENLDTKSLKEELINLKYYPNKANLNTIILKANRLEANKENTLNKLILISDFQSVNSIQKADFSKINASINFVKLVPKEVNNYYIDSVSIEENSTSNTIVNVFIKSSQKSSSSIPVSLLNNSKLLGKTTSKFINSNNSTVQFTIPNSTNFIGEISLIDDALQFDNSFFFSISKPEKINVLSIGNTSEFLSKIYSENEFIFTPTPLQILNYNKIQDQHLIILNELENIPTELINSLQEFTKKGGSLVIIPSENSTINSYNSFFQNLNLGKITSKTETEHKIITINYEHPLLKDVFEKRVDNFQYPKTNLQYHANLKNSSSIIILDNNQPFISSINNLNGAIYWVTSPLNNKISDFTQSPLVVPIFYNFAKKSLKTTKLYYTIKPENDIEVKTSIGKDKVLKMLNEKTSLEFIPLQISSQNKVKLTLNNHILQSGFYSILSENKPIKTTAFNYNREESDLNTVHIESLIENKKNVTISSSITGAFNEINNQQKINWLFKWFLAFSVLFLLIEMLILKYFKK
ncbi:BatA domain-containing protein [uncultured Lutibacter sp.]|uniref:BatA domain-containing protein n=1 Tax=uncultured Lutibacter sp. TaxID=437739 RepID=UPI00260ED94E|nr:BatA domain-containing protein [uncultured Lutibacter sp.]